MTKEYIWAKGTRVKVAPKKASEEFERIRAKYRKLRPENVVQESKPAKALLHKEFVWDDKKAADAFRIERARDLIRHLRVVIVGEQKQPAEHRVYVNVDTSSETAEAGDAERSYVPKVEVLKDEELHHRALGEAIRLLIAFRRRFEELAELRPVFREIDKLTKAYAADMGDTRATGA